MLYGWVVLSGVFAVSHKGGMYGLLLVVICGMF